MKKFLIILLILVLSASMLAFAACESLAERRVIPSSKK